MVRLIDLKQLHSSIEEKLLGAVQRVIESGWYIGGEEVRSFEMAFAQYIGVEHCVGCANGTDALEIILRAYDIGPGDEVIVPAMTWVSDAEAVCLIGAKPIFADVLPNEYTLDPAQVLRLVNHNTKAIIAVHLYGMPCRMDELVELAGSRNLIVIEDCAQSHGAEYMKKKVGGIGHAAAFSFYPTKNLGALGDGGAITTNDPDLAHRVRLIADHGQPRRDEHVFLGRNSRLDPIQAAVLNVKLHYLDEWNGFRQKFASDYQQALNGLYDFTRPVDGIKHVYHQFVVETENREQLRQKLDEAHIETGIHYPRPLNKMEYFGDYVSCPNSEILSERILSLPVHPALDFSDVEHVVEYLSYNSSKTVR